jgi:hypothetical protein
MYSEHMLDQSAAGHSSLPNLSSEAQACALLEALSDTAPALVTPAF